MGIAWRLTYLSQMTKPNFPHRVTDVGGQIWRVLLGRSVSSELPNQYRVVITEGRPWMG